MLLLFYFLNCCGHMVIQCIILYTLLYILNISFFFLSAKKRRICWRPNLVSFSLPKSLTARLLGFLENHFPQREKYHSMPTKSLSNVCQSYSAGNEGPLRAQTQVLWRPRKTLPSTGPVPPLPDSRSS